MEARNLGQWKERRKSKLQKFVLLFFIDPTNNMLFTVTISRIYVYLSIQTIKCKNKGLTKKFSRKHCLYWGSSVGQVASQHWSALVSTGPLSIVSSCFLS